jgi:hypothetical protein
MAELMRPTINQETGEVVMENDLSSATFDVVADVGPSSSSKREATVRALTGVLQMTQDPETQQVITAMTMMNMEGEGMSDANSYFRKKLLRMGVVKPTDDEAQELMAEMQGQPQDPNSMYLQAAAEDAEAKAAQARANTIKTIADAELSQAKTAEVLAGIDQEPQTQQAQQAQPMTADAPMVDQVAINQQAEIDNAIEQEKREIALAKQRLELYTLQRKIEIEEEKHALDMRNSGVQIERDESGQLKTRTAMDERSERVGLQMAEAVDSLTQVIKAQAETIQAAAERGAEAQTKTAEIMSKPRTIIRDKGKIVGIKVEG